MPYAKERHMDLRAVHHQAVDSVTPVVELVTPDQLELPTPCAEWSLRQLLEHMVGQNHGFAAAARGQGAELAVWAPRALGDDPSHAWAVSAGDVVAAFAAAADDETMQLAEFGPGAQFPVKTALSFVILDTLIHGWDVAVTTEQPFGCDAETARLLVRIAREVPADPAAREPGRPFRPALDLPATASPFDQALALTGRDPLWSPPPWPPE
jgi:uncharacterized protein (TIGR03086 family)